MPSMRSDNKGLTVKINLWALEKYMFEFSAKKARLCIAGKMTNAETGEAKMFHDAGELITTLGKWNGAKFKQLKKTK